MKYFNNLMSLEEVKATYRKMAMKLHPDCGGDEEEMKALNEQFSYAYQFAKVHNPSKQEKGETVYSFTREFYIQNGWKGSRYDSSLSTKEIAQKVREYAKYAYPDYKFSISCKYFSGGSSCSISLIQSPYELTNDKLLDKWCRNNTTMYGRIEFYNGEEWCHEETEEDIQKYKKYTAERVYHNWNFNEYYDFEDDMEERSPIDIRVLEAIKDVMNYLKSYHFDDSDSQIDYFDTNFYFYISIGRGWEKPCEIKAPKNWKIADNTEKEIKIA
jgi:hypothetical protein